MNQGEHNRLSECGWFVCFSAVVNPPGTNEADLVSTASGSVYAPPQAEALAYDDDGNLLNDGRFTYTWNGENRLVCAEEQVCPTNRTLRKVEYAYDHQGRMVWKVVSRRGAEAQSWEAEKSIAYLWDSFNIIAETTAAGSATNISYNVWGLDINGSMQGAGGVGGLLAVVKDSATYVPTYDSNGNIMEYVSADGTIGAHYEYSPFGETVKQVGPLADAFAFRFSAKYWENEANLYYYGYRFYNPTIGRWLNRDLIEENGGLHLYVFSMNSPIWVYDVLGLKGESACCSEWKMRYNLLYGETVRNKDGGNETLATCILNRLKDEYNPIAAAIELAAAGGGITATAMIFEMLKLGKASTVLGHGAGYYLIAQELRVLFSLKDAGLWCQEEKCVAFVEKVITTNARSKWNPRYWLDSPTYECIACPEGSDEVFPNSDGEVWREKP